MSLKNYSKVVKPLFLFASVFLTAFSYGQKTQAEVYVTAKDTELKLSKANPVSFEDLKEAKETELNVFVDPTKTFQTLIGIGGALTDAAAEVFAVMPESKKQEFLNAYYSPSKGIGYTFARTPIASCDFSSESYSYIKENDSLLTSFSLAHDLKYRIPFIKRVIAAAGGKLTLFVSPWSPPAWMKDNNDVLHGGSIFPKYRQAWANHFVKFIKGYEAEGIPIWGLTSQNEPLSPQRWESCIWTPSQERDFIKYFLGPTLKKNGLASKKLIAWDQNRDYIYHQASTILNDTEASKYVWGVGYHWYEVWAYPGSSSQFENVRRTKEAFPDKQILLTEACHLNYDYAKMNDWTHGEKYAISMVNDFNCGTVAWTDWNVLLNEKGGPNHVASYCFAPIHYDTRSSELIYTNSYYYLGHFSKFIRPGAKRIISSSSQEKLATTSFVNLDGSIVTIVLNTTDAVVNYKFWLNGKALVMKSLPHSIATIVI